MTDEHIYTITSDDHKIEIKGACIVSMYMGKQSLEFHLSEIVVDGEVFDVYADYDRSPNIEIKDNKIGRNLWGAFIKSVPGIVSDIKEEWKAAGW